MSCFRRRISPTLSLVCLIYSAGCSGDFLTVVAGQATLEWNDETDWVDVEHYADGQSEDGPLFERKQLPVTLWFSQSGWVKEYPYKPDVKLDMMVSMPESLSQPGQDLNLDASSCIIHSLAFDYQPVDTSVWSISGKLHIQAYYPDFQAFIYGRDGSWELSQGVFDLTLKGPGDQTLHFQGNVNIFVGLQE